MTMQINTALSVLTEGAVSRKADKRLGNQLHDVQAFLASELSEVEAILEESCKTGPRPSIEAIEHLIARGGKRVRPLSLLLAARCFGASGPNFLEMASVTELVHSATLLHDDVVDEGTERRGAATSRLLFGNGVSVLSGDLLLVHSLERTASAAPDHLPALLVTLRRLVEGEIVQLRGRTQLDMSEETYYQVLSNKTASLFSFATKTGALMAGASQTEADALASYGEHLGVAFQLVDDVLDYDSPHTGKAQFADLLEGKLTLPLVLAVQKDPSLGDLVAEIHCGKTERIEQVSQRVLALGTCEEVRQRALGVTEKARAALQQLPPSAARTMLDIVALELTKRIA
ncbi:MAG: polyprenyl synthetase family protein [Polyangiaceae bacterium]|nr:polyprenyl synthetase family protein [Polyangiaceae bacterium]